MGMFKIIQKLIALLLLILLPLTSCISSNKNTPNVQADCFHSATALAWLDVDGNGVWDEGEQPLEGIEFVLEPTVYSRTKSDENGIANIFATTPGENCNWSLQVMAVGFTGYEPTTPKIVDYISADEQYMFGFQPIE